MRGEYSNFSPDLCVVAFGGYVLYDANNNAYCDIRTIDREGNAKLSMFVHNMK